ncbi:MAG: thymidine phosphorylase [Planctomycetota bacterium]
MRAHPAELIKKKRDGGELAEGEVRDLVAGVVDGSLGDAQLGAFLMAVCCRGMTVAETTHLTLAMRDSGTVLDLSAVPGRKVDKHSTGGVGDKVSLPLAPLVAAAGVPVPMISGRGLGHTGGTIDKLQAIPGYRTDLSLAEFGDVLRDCGFVMAGASAEIAPADRRMYATRDVSGTVESIPLITASILSKKLAEGIDGLVMDVKCGRAAFMRQESDARALMRSLVDTGRGAGKQVSALITDMDTVLGRAAGNALEVVEALECLRGGGPPDLRALTLALGAEMLLLAGIEVERAAAETRLARLLDSGAALDRFARNVERQGGNAAIVDDPGHLGVAPVVVEVTASCDGYVVDLDPLAVGLAVRDLGGGRRHASDRVDPVVGVMVVAPRGTLVRRGEPLARVHARTPPAAEAAATRVHAAFVLGEVAPHPHALILDASR